jgi:Inositol hexakisphosphate
MDSGNGELEGPILPTWTSVDNGNVKTSRELWEAMKSQGWNVDVRTISYMQNIVLICSCDSIIGMLGLIRWYTPNSPFLAGFLSRRTGQSKCVVALLAFRIAFSHDYRQDNYLDAYVQVIRATDPLRTALVFSCGMGTVRTTFAMVAASILRRKQFIARGIPDPYAVKVTPMAPTPVITQGSGTNTVSRVTVTLSVS